MQPTIAIIYASGITGTTKKTGKYIAEALGADVFDLKKQTVIDISGYRKIIFGTGVHGGKPYAKLVDFIEANKAAIERKSTALYICCKYDGDKGDEQCKRISESFGITNASYFTGRGEKNENGFLLAVDEFISKQRV